MINKLDYEAIKFPVLKLKDKTIFSLMCFVMKVD